MGCSPTIRSCLGDGAGEHKRVLKFYTLELLDSLLLIVVSLLIAAYSFYSFMSVYPMLITLPIVMYCVLRYFYLAKNNSKIIRRPELFYRDKGLVIGALLWFVFSVFLIYVYPVVS